LWDNAAEAARRAGNAAAAIDYAGRALDYYTEHSQPRAAAAARSRRGLCLQGMGRHAEAREELLAALEILRVQPDVHTVRALEYLASLEAFSGSPDADRLSTEALTLGQALDVDLDTLMGLFLTRAIYLLTHHRRPEAAAYLRENVRLATQAGESLEVGRALLNLSDLEASTDPAAAAEDARAAASHLRRAGATRHLAVAIANLTQALLMLGDWNAAEAELSGAADADGLGGFDYIGANRGLVAALRGDAATAQATLDALGAMRASEDPQAQCQIFVLEAFTAVARDQPAAAFRHARATLSFAEALGLTSDSIRWAWPLAARMAWDLGDTAAATELLGMIDARQPGELSRLLWAERDLARARLAPRDDTKAAAEAFAAAIRSLRDHGTPYHLAHGLLDHASYLADAGDATAASQAAAEARDLAGKLRCQPLLDRTDDLISRMPDLATPPADSVPASRADTATRAAASRARDELLEVRP
ncbi:MAG: hypothetical protein WBH47_05905, partial [Streptosporangiaceae bacterium]